MAPDNSITITEHVVIRIVAGLAAICTIGVTLFGLMAAHFDWSILDDPSAAIAMGKTSAHYSELAFLCDIMGFYLLEIPIAIFLWRHLRLVGHDDSVGGVSVLMDYATVAGILYCLTGAIGASMLSVVFPFLMNTYADAPDDATTTRDSATQLHALFSDMVNNGIWGRVEFLLCAVWWLGTGIVVTHKQQMKKSFGILSIVLGATALIAWFGFMISHHNLAETFVNIYLILVPIWLLTIAFNGDLLQQQQQQQHGNGGGYETIPSHQ